MPADRDFDAAGEPLSYPVVVSRVPRDGQRIQFTAGDGERAALARFLAIVSVEKLVADIMLSPWRRDGIAIKGWLDAEIVQESVVTLEPVAQSIREPVALLFVPETSKLAKPRLNEDGEIHLDPEGDDLPDTFSGDRIDLGPALREVLALALDPYPREPDAAFEDRIEDSDDQSPGGAGKVSPFAALAKLKPGSSDG